MTEDGNGMIARNDMQRAGETEEGETGTPASAEAGQAVLQVPVAAFDRLAPISLWARTDGIITHAGPTLAKIVRQPLLGEDLFALFDFRQPRALSSLEDLPSAGLRVLLRLRADPAIGFRGLALPIDGRIFVQLAAGISLLERLGEFALTAADLSPADLTSEILYLLEAQAAVLRQSRDLNRRLEEARARARKQALTDPLTGLWNRRAMLDLLETLIAARTPEPFALMQIDLDHFKKVNDTLGHAAGDHVLRRVAKILRSETRREDLVARVGGDEFVLIFRSVTDPKDIDAIARRIIARLEEPIPFEGHECRISASIGTTFSRHYTRLDVDRMLEDADRATYASKRAGRGCHHIHTPDLHEDRSAPP